MFGRIHRKRKVQDKGRRHDAYSAGGIDTDNDICAHLRRAVNSLREINEGAIFALTDGKGLLHEKEIADMLRDMRKYLSDIEQTTREIENERRAEKERESIADAERNARGLES